jgi:hypothetical protein
MNQMKSVFFMLVGVIALALAVVALYNAQVAKNLALSEVTLEERSPLLTPVFNEESGTWSYLAIYEVSLTNTSGPAITLASISKETSGAGFLVPLKGEEVVGTLLKYKAFMVEPTLPDIMANPKLLKSIVGNDMGESKVMNLPLAPGVSKSVRFGVSIDAYDSANQPVAQVVLLSFRFLFDNGKTLIFRRGFPIQPLKG